MSMKTDLIKLVESAMVEATRQAHVNCILYESGFTFETETEGILQATSFDRKTKLKTAITAQSALLGNWELS